MSGPAIRRCKCCREIKLLVEFEEIKKGRGWRRWECRICITRRKLERARASKKLIRDFSRTGCVAIVAPAQGDRAKSRLTHYYRLQHEAILAYGGYRCACCGVTEPLFLSLDHANNDGWQHRRIAPLSAGRLYSWLKANGYPPGFRVLCLNCNQGRYRNGGVCPHEQ